MLSYPVEVIDALSEAVEMDDVVDPVVTLPDQIPVACAQEEMRRCLDLCIQFWCEGVERSILLDLTVTLLLTGDLTRDARRRYKLIRARYKHLRFALALYSADHRAPPVFRATVAVLGHLQDAYRNARQIAVFGYSVLLRMLLTWPIWLIAQREIREVTLDDAEGFLRFREVEVAKIKQWLAAPTLTAHRFHAMRKIVSRQVSFYDTMRTLEPNDQAFRMSRFLSAINGLMGSLHDELIENSVAGRHDYHRDEFAMPEDIRGRLDALAKAYPIPS